jgi:hypothetical protein
LGEPCNLKEEEGGERGTGDISEACPPTGVTQKFPPPVACQAEQSTTSKTSGEKKKRNRQDNVKPKNKYGTVDDHNDLPDLSTIIGAKDKGNHQDKENMKLRPIPRPTYQNDGVAQMEESSDYDPAAGREEEKRRG